jgi:hypothetical protein
VRLASRLYEESLLKMPPYSKSEVDCLSCNEAVLVAESNGVVYGAVSISRKDISCVRGEWRSGFAQRLDKLIRAPSSLSKTERLVDY